MRTMRSWIIRKFRINNIFERIKVVMVNGLREAAK